MVEKRNGSGIVLSKSLMWLCGLIVTLVSVAAIPWASHMDQQVDEMARALAGINAKADAWTEMARGHIQHLADPAIHQAKLGVLDKQIESLERRVGQLEEERRP